MQRLKLYLSRQPSYNNEYMYVITHKCGYVGSHEVFVCIKRTLLELNIIDSDKTKFSDIVLDTEDVCRLLEEGVEVFIV